MQPMAVTSPHRCRVKDQRKETDMSQIIQDKISSYAKKKKERTGRPVESKNLTLKVVVVAIICFYAFFLTSRFTIGSGKMKYDFSKKELRTCSLTVSSWTYSERQKLMEVILAVEDCYITLEFNIQASAKGFISVNQVESEIVAVGSDICVIHIHASGFLEMVLRIADSESDSAAFYNNEKDIVRVDKIESKTLNEYRIMDREARISNNLTEIENLKTEIAALNKNIDDYNESINNIQKRKTYMSAQQIKEADIEINDIRLEIRNAQETITRNEDMIREYEERNVLLQKEISDIEKGAEQ